MTGQAHVPVALAALLRAPAVPGASCYGIAPEWDYVIPGEGRTEREARVQLARRCCRRCPALARCLEVLEDSDSAGEALADVVVAGEVRGPDGEIVTPRWRLADAVDLEGGRGRISGPAGSDTARVVARIASQVLPAGGRPGETP